MDINDIVPEHRDYVKKQVEIISEKRNALLNKYGIIIRLDEGGLSNYKYTIEPISTSVLQTWRLWLPRGISGPVWCWICLETQTSEFQGYI